MENNNCSICNLTHFSQHHFHFSNHMHKVFFRITINWLVSVSLILSTLSNFPPFPGRFRSGSRRVTSLTRSWADILESDAMSYQKTSHKTRRMDSHIVTQYIHLIARELLFIDMLRRVPSELPVKLYIKAASPVPPSENSWIPSGQILYILHTFILCRINVLAYFIL